MSKSLRSIKLPTERVSAIARRIKSDTKGLGYWSAVEARKYVHVKIVKEEES